MQPGPTTETVGHTIGYGIHAHIETAAATGAASRDDMTADPVDGIVEPSPARPFAAEVTHRDGTQDWSTVWATDAESARNLLRAPDTVVRILDATLATIDGGTR